MQCQKNRDKEPVKMSLMLVSRRPDGCNLSTVSNTFRLLFGPLICEYECVSITQQVAKHSLLFSASESLYRGFHESAVTKSVLPTLGIH